MEKDVFTDRRCRAPEVDREAAVARLAGNEALYDELLQMFFDEGLALRLNDILRARGAQDAAFCAHSLKGTAANLGLNGLSAAAAEVEHALRALDMPRAEEAIFEIERVYGALRARLSLP
ncbi:MAG: Hpt domain-containing protein [Clostridiaceae bacterium]|nr:Hpt domain-containing protein [Eubacteriales bacterium]